MPYAGQEGAPVLRAPDLTAPEVAAPPANPADQPPDGATSIAPADDGGVPASAPEDRGVWRGSGALIAAVGLLVGIDLAELITTFGDPRFGVGGHIVLFAAFLLLSVWTSDQRRHAFFLAMTVAPLIRIVSSGLPLRSFAQPLWYVLTSIPLFLAAIMIARALNLGPGVLSLRLPRPRHLPVELAVWASGIGLGVVEWAILRPAPLVDGHSAAWLVGTALILLICTGLMEELLFRGLLQYAAGRLFGVVPGVVFTAALFAVLHTGHRSLTDVIFVAGVGLLFGFVVRYTGSLLGVTLAHGTINIMLFLVLPLATLAVPPAQVRPQAFTGAHLQAGASAVAWNRTLRLSVSVPAARAGLRLTLRGRPAQPGGSWRTLGSAPVDSSGRAGWSVQPHTAMVYSVMIDGKPAGSEARVQVFSLVILRAQPAGSGGRLALHGLAWPPVAGHQLVVQRQDERGRWLPITTAPLTAAGRFSVQLPILGATNTTTSVHAADGDAVCCGNI